MNKTAFTNNIYVTSEDRVNEFEDNFISFCWLRFWNTSFWQTAFTNSNKKWNKKQWMNLKIIWFRSTVKVVGIFHTEITAIYREGSMKYSVALNQRKLHKAVLRIMRRGEYCTLVTRHRFYGFRASYNNKGSIYLDLCLSYFKFIR